MKTLRMITFLAALALPMIAPSLCDSTSMAPAKTVTSLTDAESSEIHILTIHFGELGKVGVEVAHGSTYTFTILLNEGWRINRILFNGTDITSAVNDEGKITTPAVTSDSDVRVFFEAE